MVSHVVIHFGWNNSHKYSDINRNGLFPWSAHCHLDMWEDLTMSQTLSMSRVVSEPQDFGLLLLHWCLHFRDNVWKDIERPHANWKHRLYQQGPDPYRPRIGIVRSWPRRRESDQDMGLRLWLNAAFYRKPWEKIKIHDGSILWEDMISQRDVLPLGIVLRLACSARRPCLGGISRTLTLMQKYINMQNIGESNFLACKNRWICGALSGPSSNVDGR